MPVIRDIAPLVGSLVALAAAERLTRWWYRRHPIEPPQPPASDIVLRRGLMPGGLLLFVSVLFIWIALKGVLKVDDVVGGLAVLAWFVLGFVTSRIGLRWTIERELLAVGPTGVRLPGRGRLSWDEIGGVAIIGENIVLVSDARRNGCSALRGWMLDLSSEIRGYRIWAMPQTQFLSPRDLAELLGQLDLARVRQLAPRGPNGVSLWKVIRRRLDPG